MAIDTQLQSRKIRDRDWVRQSFLVGSVNNDGVATSNLQDIDKKNRFFSTASFKFVDTTPGGNLAINPPPQYCRNADIKKKSILVTAKPLGRYYSEAIDDNSRLIRCVS